MTLAGLLAFGAAYGAAVASPGPGVAAVFARVLSRGLRGAPAEAVADDLAAKVVMADSFAAVVRSYAWAVAGLDELKIAPFHLLASEGKVHADRPHLC